MSYASTMPIVAAARVCVCAGIGGSTKIAGLHANQIISNEAIPLTTNKVER